MRTPAAFPFRVLLAAILLAAAGADAPMGDTVEGVVKAKAADYVFVQPAGDAGRRYWVEPTDAATRPQAAVIDGLRVGDQVRILWTGTDRRRATNIQFLRHATTLPTSTTIDVRPARPTPAPTITVDPPPAGPTPVNASSDTATRATLGERVNAAIDDAAAVGSRLLELPASMLLAAVLIGVVILLRVARRLDRRGRPAAARRVRRVIAAVAAVGVVFVIDRKLARLQREIADLREKANAAALRGPGTAAAVPTRPLLIDPAAARQTLSTVFKDVSLQPTVYDAATDVVFVRIAEPIVRAYVAVIDLSDPRVTIRLGTDLTTKTLTSAFAKTTGSTVAINGEAGRSPSMNSGLGNWRGWLVQDGKTLQAEDAGNPRPFLSFANGRATLRAMSDPVRTLPPGATDVIWGRLDSIVDGVVQTADERYRQPRTAMGTSADGRRLYLMVVDGRQPRQSVGVTRAEAGRLLAAFGCHNAMLCDEGGSSCLYLSRPGGIVNVPSDNGGEERPTYTHFGVSVR